MPNAPSFTGTLTATLKNAAGTTVASDVATATAATSASNLTITITEQTGKTLTPGTYTVTVNGTIAGTAGSATYSFNVAK